MNIDQMIEVLTAAKNGERVEVRANADSTWIEVQPGQAWWNCYNYRIAPKKEMTLVEELRRENECRNLDNYTSGLIKRAADRIKILEEMMEHPVESVSTDELLDELKRRLSV